ncbi:MAG: acyl-CoA thioesterase [Deltaproteobacteria bacterium]|jgi:acyl-CoA thioester hydrolase|nr:acyl-CoA thioesterase [Deltaproteobacteria bacterium]
MISRKYPYFKAENTKAPPPLSRTVERVVRFEEVDAINVVWHGRYPSYLEDARVAFGEAYGCTYYDFLQAGLTVPVKQLGLDYIGPLRFGQRCAITATLHWSAAARINFSYQIKDMDGSILTTGYSVQLFLDPGQRVFMFKPEFFADFCARWESGALTPAL